MRERSIETVRLYQNEGKSILPERLDADNEKSCKNSALLAFMGCGAL